MENSKKENSSTCFYLKKNQITICTIFRKELIVLTLNNHSDNAQSLLDVNTQLLSLSINI